MGKENTRLVVDGIGVSLCYLSLVSAVAWMLDGCGAPTAVTPTRSPEPKAIQEPSNKRPQPTEAESVQRAFGSFQVIGEGSRFLTVKIDLARERAHGAQITALVLDRDQVPLRYVTGYAFRPDVPAREHLWFFFLIYAPGSIPEPMRQSHFIRFSFASQAGVKLEKIVAYQKSWQTQGEAKIFDLPAPPAEVEGVLVLKDNAFFARGDLRKPEGYFVEGKVIGERGSYTHFKPMSEIMGKEPEPVIPLETQRGWLELTTGATHAAQEAVAPISPYVSGWWDGKGFFHPDPRVIY